MISLNFLTKLVLLPVSAKSYAPCVFSNTTKKWWLSLPTAHVGVEGSALLHPANMNLTFRGKMYSRDKWRGRYSEKDGIITRHPPLTRLSSHCQQIELRASTYNNCQCIIDYSCHSSKFIGKILSLYICKLIVQ